MEVKWLVLECPKTDGCARGNEQSLDFKTIDNMPRSVFRAYSLTTMDLKPRYTVFRPLKTEKKSK